MTVSRRTILAQALLASSIPLAATREALAQTTTQYTYDALGRLTGVIYPNGDFVQYTYDAAGNRTQVVRSTSGFNQTIQVTGTSPVDLRTLASSNGYSGAQDATVVFEVGNGVTITGAASGGIAIDSGTWPTGSYAIAITLVVKNGGIVRGGGGTGGAAAENAGGAGGPGGDAIYCRLPMSINFESGSQARGGGGGGGGSASVWEMWTEYRAGGGGGGGAPNGPGGAGDGFASWGSSGTTSGGGAGGAGYNGGFDGGNGGGYGAAGSNAASWISPPATGGAGGAGGYCVRKNGHTVSVTNNGSTSGTIG